MNRGIWNRIGQWLLIVAIVCLLLGATTALGVLGVLQITNHRALWEYPSFFAAWLLACAVVSFAAWFVHHMLAGPADELEPESDRIKVLEERLSGIEEAFANRLETEDEVIDSVNSSVEAINELSRRVRDLEQDVDDV